MKDLLHTEVPTNFVYPDIKPEHYRLGALPLKEINLSGDWRPFLPPEEDQNVRGIESSACYVEAQQHAIATIEEHQFGELNNNYSSRFNALLSGGTPSGGDPLVGADSIRNDGLVTDSAMPFDTAITSWDDFHSWKGVSETSVRAEGKAYRSKKKLNNEIVFDRNVPLPQKQMLLRQALKASPVPLSVTAWYVNNDIYYKPEGLRDNHLVEAVYIDSEGYTYIRDTYSPYLKKLDKNYNFDFAMRWEVQKRDTVQELTTYRDILTVIRDWWLWFIRKGAVEAPKPPVIDPPVNEALKPDPKPQQPVKDRSEAVYAAAYSCLGRDLSKLAPDEQGCAESVSRILRLVYPDFPIITSTTALDAHLRNSPRFTAVQTPKKGYVTMFATRGGTIGHVGIMGKRNIMSNTSATGLFLANYDLTSWYAAAKKRKLPLTHYQPL